MQPENAQPFIQPVAIPNQTHHRSSHLGWWLIGSLVVIILGVLLVMFGMSAYGYYHSLILPGVSFQGTSLAGRTQAQAAERINQVWNVNRTLKLTDGQQTWETPPFFLGLWLDPNQTADKAYQSGREIGWTAEITGRTSVTATEIPPVVLFNAVIAKDNLTRWAELMYQPAQDAELTYTNGELNIKPAVRGLRLDLDRTLAALSQDPTSIFMSGRAQVFFQPVEPKITDISQIADQIKQLQSLQLGGSLFDPISGKTTTWEIPQTEIDGWVQVEKDQAGNYLVSFNQQGLVGYLTAIDTHISLEVNQQIETISDPETVAQTMLSGQRPLLMIHHLPTEYVAKGGEAMITIAWKVGIPMWRIMQANPGVSQTYIPAGTRLVIPSPDDLLPLPVVANKRIIISITKQHMWVYQDGEQIRDFVISTGIPDSPTQPGVYQVQTHEINAYADNWDLWMPHWLGIYEAWPGFMNGIHGLPMLSSGVRLWKNVLGRPASYGCIILDLPEAEWLYGWAENGVVVEIQA